MIDYYPAIYTTIAKSVREKMPVVHVTGSLSLSPKSKFPCVAIEEISNLDDNTDNGPVAPYARLQYRITVQSNKSGGKLTEARAVLAAVDSVMQSLNFRRTSMTTQDGLYNNSVYKIEAVYTARIDQNGTISLSK